MARPTITNERLLSAAREVFLAEGIRATTAMVAARAGVSEALIFKRFGTKNALFVEAMRTEFIDADQAWLLELEARAGHGDVREHLIAAGIDGLAFFERLIPMIMMSWSNLDDSQVAEHHARSNAPPFETRRRVEAWFENELRLGRIRPCDSEILARFYLGSLYSFASWNTTLGAHDPRPLGAAAYVRGVVDLIWRGIRPGVSDA